ncbi:MAG: hypothetical protein JO235_09115 [Chroococcidiopsidaceae cyanobacterium CP_BM_RX_35]|nr:hypothetical protein [Chroococcidiopsidaceae cyanobacterium CP_BM_RX_35]
MFVGVDDVRRKSYRLSHQTEHDNSGTDSAADAAAFHRNLTLTTDFEPHLLQATPSGHRSWRMVS